jgi:hypothetical protein
MYNCLERDKLLSHYFQMIDFNMIKKKGATLTGYLKVEMGYKILNTEDKSYYNVNMEVFRTALVLKFKKKGYSSNDVSYVDVLSSEQLF